MINCPCPSTIASRRINQLDNMELVIVNCNRLTLSYLCASELGF